MNYFSKNFNYLLKLKNYSVTKISKILAVSRATIYYYLDGTMLPSIERLIKISDIFNTDVKTLVTINMQENNH